MRKILCMLFLSIGLAFVGSAMAQIVTPFQSKERPVLSRDAAQTRSFAQYEWDPAQDRIVRRSYDVVDVLNRDQHDLRWLADSPNIANTQTVDGTGVLIWRKFASDASSKLQVVATLRATFKSGAATGYGDFHHISGLRYQGDWTDGVMEGQGLLLLPDGSQYVGGFKNGKEDGRGLRTDVFGNVLDGVFAAGLADGPGIRRPKTSRAYKAIWADGKEQFESRVPIEGVSGTAHLSDAAAQIYPDIEVGVSVSPPLPDTRGNPAFLPYVLARTPQAASIQPDDARLLDRWRGNVDIREQDFASLTPSFAGNRERYGPIPIVISVANRGAQTLRIVGAYLDMQFSQSDRRPAFVLNDGSEAMCGSGFNTDVTLRNYGWGAAEKTQVNLLFVDQQGTAISRSFAAELGTVQKEAIVDFADVFQSFGVNVPVLRDNPFTCTADEDCLEKARASGLFGSLAGAIKKNGLSFEVEGQGAVQYSWKTSTGETQIGQAPFSADFAIGTIKLLAECGAGSPTMPIMSNILTLPADSGPQPIPLAIRQDIAAGTVARFSLNIAASMTSNHKFQIVLQVSDGREAASIPVEMLYFTPNHWDTP